jgi:hypothetical protein
MIWKVAVAVIAVFGLRLLTRRFRDPDIYWD